MGIRHGRLLWVLLSILALAAISAEAPADKSALPSFGRDTVLVWKVNNVSYDYSLVVRIAEFFPDRFLEWEDTQSQGTIFMPNRDLLSARGFVNSNLFKSGQDVRGKDATTLWLSQQIFRDLKEKKKIKWTLDGVTGVLSYSGDDQLEVEVNRSPRILPVIKVKDDRESERWFLDQEDNPLLLRLRVRNYDQVLASITTDKANTLRWIKGKKLENPPK